jgi:hypothetical protein
MSKSYECASWNLGLPEAPSLEVSRVCPQGPSAAYGRAKNLHRKWMGTEPPMRHFNEPT